MPRAEGLTTLSQGPLLAAWTAPSVPARRDAHAPSRRSTREAIEWSTVDRMEQLLLEFKESFERKMRLGFAELHAGFDAIDARLDEQSALLDRQEKILRSAPWMKRMD
jgi:hypothetical protein